jgi:hypothetical protein
MFEKGRTMRLRLLVMVCVLLFAISCAPLSEDDLPPEPLPPASQSGDLVGQAFYTHEEGFSSPYDVYEDDQAQAHIFFIDPATIDLDFEADTFDVTARVNHQGGVVYKKGYVFTKNGWELYEFPQQTIGTSNWIRHQAEVTLPLPRENFNDGTTWVIAYSCKKHDGRWVCGAQQVGGPSGFWMLQSFVLLNVGLPAEPPAPNTCTDSDSGAYNYDVIGTVHGLDENDEWIIKTDYCGFEGAETGKLMEFGCTPDNHVMKNPYDCSSGCSQGACLPAQCTDSDGGNDIFTKGVTEGDLLSGNHITFTDYCRLGDGINSNTMGVEEGQCGIGDPSIGTFSQIGLGEGSHIVAGPNWRECPSGCDRGACIPDQIQCTNQDFILGQSGTFEFSNGDDPSVTERYEITVNDIQADSAEFDITSSQIGSNSGTGGMTTRSISSRESVSLPFDRSLTLMNIFDDNFVQKVNVCLNGIGPVPVCVDSDNGLDYNKKGNTVGIFGGQLSSFPDQCTSNPDELLETYCSGDAIMRNYYTCPNGCLDGVCIGGTNVGDHSFIHGSNMLNINEYLVDVVQIVTEDDWELLRENTLFTSSQLSVNYAQVIRFEGIEYFHAQSTSSSPVTEDSSAQVVFGESDDDLLALHLKFINAKPIAEYELSFTPALRGEIDPQSSDPGELTNLAHTEFLILGKPYKIAFADHVVGPVGSTDGLLIVFVDGLSARLFGGATDEWVVEGSTYRITPTVGQTAGGVDAVNFLVEVGGQAINTGQLVERESYALPNDAGSYENGVTLMVDRISYDPQGTDVVTFWLGSPPLVLRDDNILDINKHSHDLRVGSEDIEGAHVVMQGSVDADVNTNEVSTVHLDKVLIKMIAQDDFWLPIDDGRSFPTPPNSPSIHLSNVIETAGEEKEILFTNNWDIQTSGISQPVTETVALDAVSGNQQYRLEFTNNAGRFVSLPLAYKPAQENIRFGAVGIIGLGQLWLDPARADGVAPGDYFIVNSANDFSSVTTALRYESRTSSDPAIEKFAIRVIGGADASQHDVLDFEYTLPTGSQPLQFDVPVDGTTYRIEMVGGAQPGDFNVKVISGDAGTTGVGTNKIFTENGMIIQIEDTDESSDANPLGIDFLESGNNPLLGYDIPAIGPAVDLTPRSGLILHTPDTSLEDNYGYSSHGTYVHFFDPTAPEGAELNIIHPAEQVEVFVGLANCITGNC